MAERNIDFLADFFSDKICRIPTLLITVSTFLAKLVTAQAPASDLTQYPSGLASAAVVIHYAVSSDKDNLCHRRRIAGFGAEHVFRDLVTGPRLRREKHITAIVFNRKRERLQRTAWGVRFTGEQDGYVEVGVPTLRRTDSAA